MKGLEKIRKVIGTPGDVLNKARIFDDDVKTRGEVSAAKIIKVLVSFSMRMDATLAEMKKLVAGSSTAGSSQVPPPNPQEQPKVESSLIKEAVAQAAKIQVPVPEVQLVVVLAASILAKEKKKAESETKVASSEPSSARKSEKKMMKKREPSTKSEEEEELTVATRSFEEGMESKDEEVLATLPAEKRRSINTRSSDKKAPPFVYKTPLAPKSQAKTSPKGESSRKRPKVK